MSFPAFFSQATAGRQPYGYQCRLACGPQADPAQPETLHSGTACQSQLISIPTGLGKTAAVVLPWLESLLRSAVAIGSILPFANNPALPHLPHHDLAAEHHPLASASPAREAAPPLADSTESGGAEHGVRERAGGRETPPRDTRPDHATRYVETTRGILSYAELAPLLAERVQAVLSDLVAGLYADRPLDEQVLPKLHARIAGDRAGRKETCWAGILHDLEKDHSKLMKLIRSQKEPRRQIMAAWRTGINNCNSIHKHSSTEPQEHLGMLAEGFGDLQRMFPDHHTAVWTCKDLWLRNCVSTSYTVRVTDRLSIISLITSLV